MHVGTQYSQTVCMWVSVICVMYCHMCSSAYVCVCLCVCVCACVCVCVCVNIYASVVFKNGKGSFTQCILVHMYKGV